MGMESGARCKACGHTFRISEGGGFAFHLLRCDRRGETRSVTFDELGLIHLRYLKGLPGPYSVATAQHDQQVKHKFTGKPLSERGYHAAVQKYAGKHSCGGAFKFRAPPRCPRCHSADQMTDPSGGVIMYD